jgi:hypothetical protein
MYTNASERLRIDTSGNVGIGTSSPTSFGAGYTVLDVYNGTTGGYILVRNPTHTGQISVDATGMAVQTRTVSPITFNPNNIEKVRITSDGNVGIGTSTPGTPLHILNAGEELLRLATSGVNPYLSFYTGTTTRKAYIQLTSTGLYYDAEAAATGHIFGTQGIERMRIDSTGVIGIGITTAGSNAGVFSQLQIGGTSTANSRTILYGQKNASAGGIISNGYYDASNNLVYSQTYGVSQLYLNNGTFIFSNAASGTAGTNVTVAEAMRIDTSGNLLIGTTSPLFSSVRRGICVLAPTGTFVAASFANDAGANAQTTDIWNKATTGNNAFVSFFTEGGSGSERGNITYNRAGGLVVYGTTSDYRLKKNIVDLPNALQTVLQLKPRQFDWKETGNTTTGFIAHELAEICPHAVIGSKDDIDDKSNPKYQNVDTSFLVATLTKAIQEQQALIESLTTRLTALENK